MDRLVTALLVACGSMSIFTTLAIIAILLTESIRFFGFPDVTLREFFLGDKWSPLLGAEKHFGIRPLICGTFLVAGVAAMFAIPIGLITAIYLSEYAPRRVRAVLKPVLEVLAGVPTVVYGVFALTVITPSLQWVQENVLARLAWAFSSMEQGVFGNMAAVEADKLEAWGRVAAVLPEWATRLIAAPVASYNALSAGLAVGIMILPIVCSLSEDALQAVPRSLREGAYAVGGTRFDVATKVVAPAALSGIIASFLLAIARAVGETMIVALAAGGLAQLTMDPRQSVQTMTAYMVQIFLGDTATLGVEYYSSYAVAGTLFVLTMVLTLIGHRVMLRFREVYS